MAYGSRFMPDGMRGKRRMRNLQNGLPIRYVQGTMAFPVGSRSSMYTPEYLASLGSHDPYARQTEQFKAVEHLDVVSQMQYVDAHNYLIDDILVKVDKASMLNSLETRAPLLDQHLVEYVTSLRSDVRMHDGILKYLLKQTVTDLLPPEVLTRKKQGFAIPLRHWFRRDLASYTHEMLESSQARQRGIFNPQFVSNLLSAHETNKLVDHSSAIWSLLSLELWFQTYMDEPATHNERGQQIHSISHR